MHSAKRLWQSASVKWRFQLLTACVVLIAALAALALFVRFSEAERAQIGIAESHSTTISTAIESLLLRLGSAHSSLSEFLLTGQDVPLASYKKSREILLAEIERLQTTFNNEPTLRKHRTELVSLIEKHLLAMERLRPYAVVDNAPHTPIPHGMLGETTRLLEQIHRITREMHKDAEVERQTALAQAQQSRQLAEGSALATIVLGLFGIIAGAWLLVDRIVVEERRRAHSAVYDSQRQLEEMLARTRTQARDLVQSEEELRRHKQVLESVLDSLQDGVAVVAPGGELLLFNPAAARIFESLPTISLEQWAAYYGLRPPEGTPCAPDCFTIARALQGEQIPEQTVFVAQGDEGLWLRLSARPLLTPTGEVRAALVVFTDITVHHHHQEVLSRAKEQAERANQAKSEFLSRMSHELRTPLNAILGFAQLLEMARFGHPHHDSVGQILRAGRHLLTLINEVLEISRIESGTLSLSLEAVSVGELTGEAVAMLQPHAATRAIHLDISAVAGSELCVIADRQRLRQVIINLLSNAIKYNRPQGSVVVSCESRNLDSVRLLVSDTGCGISAEQKERLFTPFERLGAEKSGIEGTGIGLALSKRLVEAMCGTIDVESVPDNGSTFRVTLPRAQQPLTSLSAAPEAGRTNSALYRPKILCIEDNPSNLQLIEGIFSTRPEIQLITATTGMDGLRLASEHCPALVLLDIHLPDIDGEEVLGQLKRNVHTNAIPVVVVSADATARQEARLREAGACDYLTKPLDVPKFLARIEETLHHASV